MLQRWNPASDLDRMWNEMDRMLSEGLGRRSGLSRSWASRPALDVFDNGDQIVVKAMLPGSRPEDIDVTIEQNTLTLKGRFGAYLNEDETKHVTWYRREIGVGQFAETFTLPVPVDSERATASFADGILTLTLPKSEQARVRKISVQSSTTQE